MYSWDYQLCYSILHSHIILTIVLINTYHIETTLHLSFWLWLASFHVNVSPV
jgi:hypothetical protein